MARIIQTTKTYALIATALVLAASAGVLAATALGTGAADPPTRTVTVNIPTQAPTVAQCIAGYSPGILVLNAPGGQVSVYTCLKNE